MATTKTYAATDTLGWINANRTNQANLPRTLRLTRLVEMEPHFNPQGRDEKDAKQNSCQAICNGAVFQAKLPAEKEWQALLPADQARRFYGKLQSRLILNAAVGVLENSGVSLDRNSGLPVIPGSALKGCARHAALQAVHNETSPAQKQALLLTVCRLFGWVPEDWKEKKRDKDETPDLIWACGNSWASIKDDLFAALADIVHCEPGKVVKSSYAGSVCFLPAFPDDADPGLDIDILTSHHQKYYSSDKAGAVATDDEQPIPVTFLTISPEKEPIFRFVLTTLARRDASLLDSAEAWLKEGLQTWGIGGKTAAGYGWFDCSDAAAAKAIQADEAQQLEKQKAEERATLQADPKILEELDKLKEDQRRGTINYFATDPQHWTGKYADEALQLSILIYCTEKNTTLYNAELAKLEQKKKSQILKALANLARKFNRQLPSS